MKKIMHGTFFGRSYRLKDKKTRLDAALFGLRNLTHKPVM